MIFDIFVFGIFGKLPIFNLSLTLRQTLKSNQTKNSPDI